MARDRTNTESVLKLVLNGEQAKTTLKELRDTTRRFTTEFNKMRESDDPKLYAKKKEELQKLNKTVRDVSTSLRTGATDAKGFSSQISNIAKGVFGGNMLTRAWDTAIRSATTFITKNAELSDEMAGVTKTTGLSEAAVDRLNEKFKKMDTRTAKTELMGLAQVAGKLGYTLESDVEGFVRAADKIGVALGEDLGGTEDAVKSIGKLIDIFKIDDNFSLEESILKVGSAINELGSSGTASEKYLIDFTQRMAGIAPAANISMTDVMGLAATLDELGQNVESSSTAVGQFIVKMGADIPKFAAIAGMSIEEFSDLLKEDANEAFLKVMEAADSTGGGIEKLAENMGLLDVAGARGIAALGVLSGNVDKLREKQELSNKSFNDGTSIVKEFDRVNNDLAANLEKLGKRMSNLWENSSFRKWLTDITAAMLGTADESKKLTEAYLYQKEVVEDLEKDLAPMLDRYDELKRMAILNKDEQVELNKIINTVTSSIPYAAIEFDKYGTAIGISTEKAREFIESQKAMLQYKNRDAIKSAQEDIEEYNEKYKDLTRTLATGQSTWVQRFFFGDRILEMSKEARIKTTEELKKYGALLKGAEELLKSLTGEDIEVKAPKVVSGGGGSNTVDTIKKTVEWYDAEILALKKKQKAEAENAEQYKKIQSDINTLEKERKSITGGPEKEATGGDKPPKVSEAEKLQKELDKIAQDTLLNSLENNDKEVEAMRIKYQKLREKAKGNEEQLAMIGQLEADEAIALQENITKECEEEAEKQFKAKEGAMARLSMALVTDQDKELETAKAQYLKLLDLADEYGLDKIAIINKWSEVEAKIKEKQALKEKEDTERGQSKWNLTNKEFATKRKEFELQLASEIADTTFTIFNNANQARLDSALEKLEEERNNELSNKNLTESQKNKINEKYDAKVKAEKLKAWKAEKNAAIAQAVINGALAVTKVLAQTGILSPFAIPSIIAGTALQVATIASQKPPKYAKGGLLPIGPGHSQGGIDLWDKRRNEIIGNIEGGEPILSRATYANNREIVDQLLYSSQRKAGASIRLNPEVLDAERLVRNGGASMGQTPVVNVPAPDLGALEKGIDKMILAQYGMIAAQKEANDKEVILSTRLLEEENAKIVKLRNDSNA